MRGPGIDSGLPCPVLSTAVLTQARFLDHTGPRHRFIDIYYPDLMADPTGTFRRLYATLGLQLHPSFLPAVCAHLGLDERGNKPEAAAAAAGRRRAKHSYSLETFGLAEADIRADPGFARYLARHPRCCSSLAAAPAAAASAAGGSGKPKGA